jgi:hypothetical protein
MEERRGLVGEVAVEILTVEGRLWPGDGGLERATIPDFRGATEDFDLERVDPEHLPDRQVLGHRASSR